MKSNRKKLLIVILIFIDQISKFIVSNLITNETTIISNLLSFKVVGNTGFAFSLNSGDNVKNLLLSGVFIFLIIRFMKSQKEQIDAKTETVLYIILAGGISNIIDRIIRGKVLDFISIGRFPVFNIADMYVVIGWVLFIMFVINYSIEDTKLKEQKSERYNKNIGDSNR